MRSRNRRWLLAWTLSSLFPYIMVYEVATEHDASKNNSKEARGIFTPRMDYDQWTPLGRGDPLKNDPTYDYVPPVLDRVHYWIEPSSRKPDSITSGESQKTEILVLGVSSKKPSTGADSPKDTYDPFLKFIEGPKFGIQRMSRPTYNYYHQSSVFPTKNKIEDLLLSDDDHDVPYTFLMPPPVVSSEKNLPKFPQTLTSLAITENPLTTVSVTSNQSGFTIQQSNLLYHTTTVGNQNEFRDQNYFGTAGASSSQVTWRTPITNFKPQQNSSLHDSTTYKENPINNDVGSILRDSSQMMHKGQVTDDDLDIANTYVNIGKPEAQMHSPSDMKISSVSVEPPNAFKHSPILLQLMNPDVGTSKVTPITMQTLHTMQTMQPPPILHTPIFANSLHSLLQGELTTDTSKVTSFHKLKESSITSSPMVTTTTSLTTDPLFKHYKQPNEPLRGPMYLIIQGHSKVKTYGPSKQVHGISVQEINEIPSDDQYVVKHLHGYKKETNEGRLRQGRSSMLQTLSHVVQTGLGAIDFSENEANRRNDDVQETELIVSYDVSSQTDVTSERYYKGIVEAGDVARNIKNGVGKR